MKTICVVDGNHQIHEGVEVSQEHWDEGTFRAQIGIRPIIGNVGSFTKMVVYAGFVTLAEAEKFVAAAA